jgi:hypothetical protein
LSYALSTVRHALEQTTQSWSAAEQHVVHSAVAGVTASAVENRTGARSAAAAKAERAIVPRSFGILMSTNLQVEDGRPQAFTPPPQPPGPILPS